MKLTEPTAPDKGGCTDNPRRRAALDYAARGLRVIPLWGVTNGRCDCGGERRCTPGKHPWTGHGSKNGTTDPQQICRWWRDYPNANVGICTGPESGIFDVAPDGPEGIDDLAALELEHGPLPEGPRFRSGGGGEHRIHKWTAGRKIGNHVNHRDTKIDTRGEGGYCVAPPSVTDKGAYEWIVAPEAADVPEAPPWLLNWCGPKARPRPTPTAPATPTPTGSPKGSPGAKGRPPLYERARLYLRKMPAGKQGDRGSDPTYAAAAAVCHGFGLGVEDGVRLLLEEFNERCQPPWSEAELRHKCEDAVSGEHDKPEGWLREQERPMERNKRRSRSRDCAVTAHTNENYASSDGNGSSHDQGNVDAGLSESEAKASGAPEGAGSSDATREAFGGDGADRDPVPLSVAVDEALSERLSVPAADDKAPGSRPGRGGRGKPARGPAAPARPLQGQQGAGNGKPPVGPLWQPVSKAPKRRPSWLWQGRVQLGAINLLEGRKGLGKSTIAAAIVASVTGGPLLPGQGKGVSGSVLYLSVEEDMGSIIRPRLEAAGADLDKVLWPSRPTGGRMTRRLVLPDEVPDLESAIRERGVVLLVLDPWSSFTAPNINLNDERSVRLLLEPIAQLAAETYCAVLLIRHPRKSASGPALDQGLGSAGISAVARAVNSVNLDPDNPGGRVLACVTCNHAERPPSLRYTLEEGGKGLVVKWNGESDLDADRLAEGMADIGERGHRADAKRFLRLELDAHERKVSEIQKRADDSGITKMTLRRAKEELGVVAFQKWEAEMNVWYWRKPDGEWPEGA